MRRPYTPEYYSDLVASIRCRIPDASIGADVMVGFPGESDEDFRSTYRLIETSALTYLHVFPFSSRPGTVAAGMPDHVPDHVARFRAKSLGQLISGKNEEFRRGIIGRQIEALVLEDGSALSDNFIRVELGDGGQFPGLEFPRNQWIRVRVTALTGDGLQASSMTTAHEISWSCVSET
jgi:threonylcarbamoyladenosine tRNA methylthiotransferase MtaB